MRETASAHEVWRNLLVLPYPPQSQEQGPLFDLQEAGGHGGAEAMGEAKGWLRELIADPATYAPRRSRLRLLLARLEAAEAEDADERAGAQAGTGTGPYRAPEAVHTEP